MGRRGAVIDVLWLLAWGVASSAWCVTAAGRLSATFDEPVYVAKGLERWRTGSHHGLLRMGTMPLPADLQTLPLYLWERRAGVALDPAGDLDRLLSWARAGTLAFWWLLLAYGWRAGRLLAGPWGGRLAVALLACEPTLLAHAGLATTDLAVTACLVALAYHYRAGRDAGWPRRVGLPAFWYGAAVLAKASGLVFGPLVMLAVEAERRWREGGFAGGSPRSGGIRRLVRDLACITAGGLLLTFLYCGSDWRPEPSFVAWARRLPDGAAGRSLVWLAEHLRVFSNAGEGLVRQVKHNLNGHDGTYLLGAAWPRGSVWYYFPVALTMKLSPFLLALPLLVAAVRPRALLNWACVAAGALLLFSVTCRVQIGVRLVLPLVALAAVGLAGAAVHAAALPGWRYVLLRCAVPAGVVCTALAAAAVWPHGLCYTNWLWGGTADGYRLLSDSNYDWGQGLKELARWQEEHGGDPLDVWYFGTDPAVRRRPLRELPLHLPAPDGPPAVEARARGRRLAVSLTLLHGMVCDTPEHRAAATFLRTRRPVGRTTTFFIYDLTAEPE